MGRKSRKRIINKEIQKAYLWYSKECLLSSNSSTARLKAMTNRMQLQSNTAIRPTAKLPAHICARCGAIGTRIRFRIRHRNLIKTCQICQNTIIRPLHHKTIIGKKSNTTK